MPHFQQLLSCPSGSSPHRGQDQAATGSIAVGPPRAQVSLRLRRRETHAPKKEGRGAVWPSAEYLGCFPRIRWCRSRDKSSTMGHRDEARATVVYSVT